MNRFAILIVLLGGCGGTSPQNPFNSFDFAGTNGGDDMAGGGGSGGGGGGSAGDMGSGNGCTTYTKSTVAAMRMAATSGCFELDNVVSVATTPISTKSTSIRIIAQDPAGGDYSAVLVSCYDSAT